MAEYPSPDGGGAPGPAEPSGEPRQPTTEAPCGDQLDGKGGSGDAPVPIRRLPWMFADAFRLVWAAGRRELTLTLTLRLLNAAGLAAVLLLSRDTLGAC